MTGVDLGILADFSYALRLRYCSDQRLLEELTSCERALHQLAEGCCTEARDVCDRLEIAYAELRRRHPARGALQTY